MHAGKDDQNGYAMGRGKSLEHINKLRVALGFLMLHLIIYKFGDSFIPTNHTEHINNFASRII